MPFSRPGSKRPSPFSISIRFCGVLALCLLAFQTFTFSRMWWKVDRGQTVAEKEMQVSEKNLIRGVEEKVEVPTKVTTGLSWGAGGYGEDDLRYSPTYPKHPLRLKELRLCNDESMIQLKEAFKCEEDDTCVECFQGLVKRNRKLTEEFKNEISKEEKFISTINSLPQEVVLMTVNAGQAYLSVNWFRSVQQNIPDLDICSMTLVVTTDAKAEQQIQASTCLQVLRVSINKLHISESYLINKANAGAHAVINNIFFLVTNYLVQSGRHVLMHDVDQVWLRDPFPTLHKLVTGADSACMASIYIGTTKGFCNTGFVYVQPTARSKIFWESVINAMDVKKTSDQALFNMMVRHFLFREYVVRVLPLTEFNSRAVRRSFDEKNTLVYHAVSVKKKQQLLEINQWYVKKEEDPEADDDEAEATNGKP